MKICIATPMYGGNAKSVYVSSVADLIAMLTRNGHEVFQVAVTNESLITRARNTLAHEFMRTDYDALLFIDGDHGFASEDILKMVESGKDLIGAVYPMKAINWENVRKAALAGKPNLEEYSGFFAINLLPGVEQISSNEPFEVTDIGTGMMFITRKVFEDLKPICKTYKSNSVTGSIGYGEPVIEYFTTMVTEDGILLSEDYAFCRMWRSLGNSVWAAPWVRITHSGDYIFSGKFLKTLEIANETASPDSVS